MKKITIKRIVFFIALIALIGPQCAKPFVNATVMKNEDIKYVSESLQTNKKDGYNAAKWSLVMNGYSLATKDEKRGLLISAWVPTKSDSHALMLFNREDLGVNGAYYQMIVNIEPYKGKTRFDVATRIKSVASGIKSTGVEEKKILRDIKSYLRKREPNLSNVGIEE